MKTSMKKKVEIGQQLLEVVKHNEQQLELVNGDQALAIDLVTVEIDGVEISNPFMTECQRYDVQPVGYYGKANMDLMLTKYYAIKGNK